jgi:hypothetical protein
LPIADCRLAIEKVVWQLLPMSIRNRKSAITKSGEGFFGIMLESLWIADTNFW